MPSCRTCSGVGNRAHTLFESQEPAEKRRLLNSSTFELCLKDGVLAAEYRQAFDMLAFARQAAGDAARESAAKKAGFENWLPVVDACRTFAVRPPPAVRAAFQ